MKEELQSFFGLRPSSLKRRLIIGGASIFTGGFLTFAVIFYTFLLSLQTTSALCVFPQEEATGIVVSLFAMPIVILTIYIGLLAAIIYYVNPWEKIKRRI